MSYKSEPERVLDLIKDVKVFNLGHWDGCVCCHFSIRNVNVDISCGKGRDQAVRVWSNSMDYMEGYGDGPHDKILKPIAEEVRRQVMEGSSRGGNFPISYQEWKNPDRVKAR